MDTGVRRLEVSLRVVAFRCPKRVNRVVSAMPTVSPLYPHEPTSSVRLTTSEKCHRGHDTCGPVMDETAARASLAR